MTEPAVSVSPYWELTFDEALLVADLCDASRRRFEAAWEDAGG